MFSTIRCKDRVLPAFVIYSQDQSQCEVSKLWTRDDWRRVSKCEKIEHLAQFIEKSERYPCQYCSILSRKNAMRKNLVVATGLVAKLLPSRRKKIPFGKMLFILCVWSLRWSCRQAQHMWCKQDFFFHPGKAAASHTHRWYGMVSLYLKHSPASSAAIPLGKGKNKADFTGPWKKSQLAHAH